MVIVSKFEKNTKDEGGNGNGNNGNGNGNNGDGGDVSEEKTLKVKGSGEMEVKLEAEAEIESLTTSNYQTAINGECLVTYDIEAIINVKNSAEVDMKDPTCDSVEEVV